MPEYTDNKYHYLVALLLGISGLLIILIFVSIRSQADDPTLSANLTNATPTINTVFVTTTDPLDSPDTNEETLNLTALNTTTVYIAGTYTDTNGCDDVNSDGEVSVVFHRSGVATSTSGNAATCSSDSALSCYDFSSTGFVSTSNAGSTCTGAGDDTANYEFQVALEYFADATDGNFSGQTTDYSAQNWIAHVQAIDGSASSTFLEETTEVALGNGFQMSTQIIDFGTVAIGGFATTSAVTFTNTLNDTDQDYHYTYVSPTGIPCSISDEIGYDYVAKTTSTAASITLFSQMSSFGNLGLTDFIWEEALEKAQDSGAAYYSSTTAFYGVEPVSGAGVCTTTINILSE